jgi:hypothetical protein
VVGEELKTIFDMIGKGTNMQVLRVLILTSPPWGVLEANHDIALDANEIEVMHS